jgi:hypothetical protein
MASQAIQADRPNSWVLLGKELVRRSLFPLPHSSFFFYFLVAVVGLGGIGVWIELEALTRTVQPTTSSLSSLRTALISFFPALAGTSCMQLIWSDDSRKYLKSFSTAVMIAAAITAIMMARPSVSDETALWVTSIACLFALWIWWIANAFQKEFLDPPDSAVGGDPTSDKLSGDLSDYQS